MLRQKVDKYGDSKKTVAEPINKEIDGKQVPSPGH